MAIVPNLYGDFKASCAIGIYPVAGSEPVRLTGMGCMGGTEIKSDATVDPGFTPSTPGGR